jgi:hypothetical protein
MKRMGTLTVLVVLLATLAPLSVWAAPPVLNLPAYTVTANHGTWQPAGWPASFDIVFSGIGADYSVADGEDYLGWCLEANGQPNTSTVTLYSTYDAAMPLDALTYQDAAIPRVVSGEVAIGDPIPWAEVNWLLNNKPTAGSLEENRKDVQDALWLLLWGEAGGLGTPTATAIALADEAKLHPTFEPDPNLFQVVAVLLYADGIGINNRQFQDSIIELPLRPPTAVDLISFSASSGNGSVELAWETATELDNLGFNVYRAGSADGVRSRINSALIPSQAPGSAVGATYTFVDESASPGVTYYYWLEDVDIYGVATVHGPVSGQVEFLYRLLPARTRPAPTSNFLRSR